MNPFRKAGGMLLVALAALAGNWLGDTLRATTTGEPGHQLGLVHTSKAGQTVLGLNVALTNFVPALVLALLAGKPRTLYAFISGAVISTLLGDSYERALARWLGSNRP
ncbi:MAG TPA: hypothetical protein PLO33_04325 [Kouleothrix sp.]|uniref:hypothetical protein n=1 Tax=Kouleothrix sp. TaxID=2779161 RepID=UPI002BC94758|nr:hypothetical protein [Kouleothrix sp.]HRC74879.1 hypothetical protein [Kouleothrix sp.]